MTETNKETAIKRYRAVCPDSGECLFQIEAADFEQAMHCLRRLRDYTNTQHPHKLIVLEQVLDASAPVTTSIFLEGYFIWLDANARIS